MVSQWTMVAWSCQIYVTMMVLLWLINLTCSSHPCPKDLLHEVFSCLKNLTHGSNQSTLVSDVDAELMRRNCGTGAFDDSVQCLQRLYDRCDSSEAQEWLNKLARPRRWQSGFERFCEHVNLYTQQKHCIHEQNEQIEDCVNKNKRQFEKSDKYVYHTREGYEVDESVIKTTCSVFHWTEKCLSGPLRNSCGREVGAVLADFQGGITPPMCKNYSPSASSYQSTSCLLTLVTILLLLLRQINVDYV